MVLYERLGRDIDRGLIGFWKLNDLMSDNSNTVAIDYSNLFNNGIILGAIAATDMRVRTLTALEYDDATDRIDGINFNSSTTTCITQVYWINKNGLSGVHRLASSTPFSFGFEGNRMFAHVTSNSGTDNNIISTTTHGITAGSWFLVVLTKDTSATNKIALYVNGTLIQEEDLINSANGIMTMNAFVIGDATQSFDGKLARVRVYNRILTKGESSKLYRLRK